MISLLDKLENFVEKGENAGFQHFLIFPHCFPKPSSPRSFKVGIVWFRVKIIHLPKTTCFFHSVENIVGKRKILLPI